MRMEHSPKVVFFDSKTPPHIATLIMLAGLSALAMNIFLPALPEMTEYFDTSYRLMQLSVAIYLGVNAALQIFVGPISDMMGRRPVILTGLAVFIVATIGCLLAQNVYVFLAFRMVQAFVVVAMVLSRAVVRDMFTADKAAAMIGFVTMGMSVVPMIGPAIGGMLSETYGWHATFVMLLVLGIIMFIMTWFDLAETATKSGMTLRAQFAEYPELLKSPRFWGYALACSFSSGAFFAYVGGAPFVATEVFGLTPAEMGFYFGAPAVGYFLGNWFSGKFSMRIGINPMVLWGGIINTGGMALSVLVFMMGHGTAITFFGFMTIIGFGNGMTIPNATAGFLSVRPRLAGTASGLGGSIMIGGGAALSALAGALLHPETGPWPLLWIMLIVSILCVVAILMVMRRNRILARLDDIA